MRLWHKDLISVLPDKQLIGQWRECCAIASNIKKLGKPNHILVNRIMDYKLTHFYKYCLHVANEMYNRNMKTSTSARYKILNITDRDIRMGSEFITFEELFSSWHDDRYFRQCYYNLEEKYDCGGITEKEWRIIENVKEKMDR